MGLSPEEATTLLAGAKEFEADTVEVWTAGEAQYAGGWGAGGGYGGGW